MVETRAELPFIGDQVVCLSHDQAARSGPRKEARSRGRVGRHARHEKPRPPLSSPGFKLLHSGMATARTEASLASRSLRSDTVCSGPSGTTSAM